MKLALVCQSMRRFKDDTSRDEVMQTAAKIADHSTMGEAFSESLGTAVFKGEDGKFYRLGWDVVLEEVDAEEAQDCIKDCTEKEDEEE